MVDPAQLADGAGVEHGRLLVELVENIASGDAARLAEHRARIDDTMGVAARIDAIAVYANFSMMTRIADGTGTPLDRGTIGISEDLCRDLGLNELTSRRV